jgi:protein gp37
MIPYVLAQAGLNINAPAWSRERLEQLDGELQRARKPRRVFVASMGDLGTDRLYHEVVGETVRVHVTGAYTVRCHVRDLIARHPRHTFLFLSKQPRGLMDVEWPDNAHVGVSLSTTKPAERDRVRALMEVTCGLRWASVEPLLDQDFDGRYLKGLDWVAIGCETGLGAAKPEVYADAAWRVVEWCRDVYRIPVFVKPNLHGVEGYEWPTEIPE